VFTFVVLNVIMVY